MACRVPADVKEWPLTIEVPYAPECERSGIGDTGFHRAVWYERDFDVDAHLLRGGRRLPHQRLQRRRDPVEQTRRVPMRGVVRDPAQKGTFLLEDREPLVLGTELLAGREGDEVAPILGIVGVQ